MPMSKAGEARPRTRSLCSSLAGVLRRRAGACYRAEPQPSQPASAAPQRDDPTHPSRRAQPLAEDEPSQHDRDDRVEGAQDGDDPAAPRVVATATRTFAPVSKMPTATSIGSSPAAGGATSSSAEGEDRTRIDTDAARPRRRPGRALVRPRIEPDDEEPEAECRDQGQPDSGASRRLAGAPDGSRESGTMPVRTRAIPTHCRRRESSPSRLDGERHDGDAAEIGATIPIAPTAIPR